MKNLTIEEIAEKLNGKIWEGRVYLNNRGHNTKKMSTTCYVELNADGSPNVVCNVECAGQPMSWCEMEAEKVADGVRTGLKKLTEEFFYQIFKKNGNIPVDDRGDEDEEMAEEFWNKFKAQRFLEKYLDTADYEVRQLPNPNY